MLHICILNNKFDLIQTKTVSHNLPNSVEYHLIQLNCLKFFCKIFSNFVWFASFPSILSAQNEGSG